MMDNKTLTDIIYQYSDEKFSWDKLDCCTFAANVAFEFKNITPPNLREVFPYKNYKDTLRWFEEVGCSVLQDAPTAYLGTERKDISHVKHGDIVYYINEDGQGIIGVCNGVRAYFLQIGQGLTTRPIEDCVYCWSIN